MSYTQEQIAKAKQAKSVEELLALSKENGVDLTEDDAKKYYAEWHKEGELSDDELDNVSGGCGEPEPKLSSGMRVKIGHKELYILEVVGYDENIGCHLYKCLTTDQKIEYLYEYILI